MQVSIRYLPANPGEQVSLQAKMMQIGDEEYASTNQSYGLTTLRTRHVRIDGKAVLVNVEDRRMARAIKRVCDLPLPQVLCAPGH